MMRLNFPVVCGPLLLLALLSGCAGQEVYEDPIAVMLSQESTYPARRAAMRQAAAEMRDDPRYREALHRLLWDRGYPHEQRKFAIDQLIALDEPTFARQARDRMALIVNPETLDYLLEQALARGWPDMTPGIIRRYAIELHGIADRDRQEYAWLQRFAPDTPVEQVVFDVFCASDNDITAPQRVAAWELLNRLVDSERVIDLLAEAPDDTPIIADLKAAGAELHTVPINREGVLWLAYLRDPARADYWRACRAQVARLSDEQRRGLELRHMPVLLLMSDDELATPKRQLHREVEAMVAAGQHHYTGPTYDGPMRDYPQRWIDWESQLPWADLATIRLLHRAMADRGMTADLFEQADADKEDISTEYGGVIDHSQGRFVAKIYKPLLRDHDRKFVPRPEMIEHMYTALAHYHFHAQDHNNSNYAGPGLGDLRLADRLNMTGVVLTFIDRDRMNVDFYRNGKIVIDLGTIHR